MAELLDVLRQPRLARFIDPEQRADLLKLLSTLGGGVVPATPMTDCRDTKDDIYLELALTAGADVLVSNDGDVIVLAMPCTWPAIRAM